MRRRDFLGVLSAVPMLLRTHGKGQVTTTYDESVAFVRRIQARDDESINPVCRTALYTHGHATDLAVVLFHGFTNCPAQYALMAQQLHAKGANVLVWRYPEHGDRNRMTTRLEGLSADRLTVASNEAVDAASAVGVVEL